MSWSKEAIFIVGGTRLDPGRLHHIGIPRGHRWARGVEGFESLIPVARDVEIGGLAEVAGARYLRLQRSGGSRAR